MLQCDEPGLVASMVSQVANQKAPFLLALSLLERCPGTRAFRWLSAIFGVVFCVVLVVASAGPAERMHSLWRMASLCFLALTLLVLASGLGRRLRGDAAQCRDLLPAAGLTSSEPVSSLVGAAAGLLVARAGLLWVWLWGLSAASQARDLTRVLGELGRAAALSTFMCALGLAVAGLIELSRRMAPHWPRRFAFGLLFAAPLLHAAWSTFPSTIAPLLWLLDTSLAVR